MPNSDNKKPNILFIMCDQLRWDYLSCSGHPTLKTPNIDYLSNQGVRFSQAFCQAPLCGPSRASFYTGRYVSSHGSMVNDDPLKLGERTISDYLGDLGYRSALVGKTHTNYSTAAQTRIGLSQDSKQAKRLACGGFEPYEVHEGLYPDPIQPEFLGYNEYLKENGYDAPNPWQVYANNSAAPAGEDQNGWLLRNSQYPANIPEEHSETAFTTNRAIEFINEANGAEPWCLHLSYIKPHWPVIAPAPYHEIYSAADVPAPIRSEEERNQHPVVTAFTEQEYSINYSKDEVRKSVIPVYMGLIKQIDDHLGRLFEHLKSIDAWDNTLIVFTSDHGDYLGDHWLGEKDLLHDCSAKIPMIVRDPRPEADATRGTASDALIQAIDILPTFIDYANGTYCNERLEGESLIPCLHKGNETEREFVVSEIDYSDRGVRTLLDVDPYLCRAYMLRTKQWKYIFYEGFRPQLFDLANDPNELNDLAEQEASKERLAEMHEQLFTWLRRRKIRTEIPYEKLADMGPELDESYGIIIGRW